MVLSYTCNAVSDFSLPKILMGYRPVRRPRSGEPRSDLALGSCGVRKREWPLELESFWLGGAFLRGWGCIWASFEASGGRIWASRGVAWKLIWASQRVVWQLIWGSLGWSGRGALGPPARLRPGRFPQAGTRTFGGIWSIWVVWSVWVVCVVLPWDPPPTKAKEQGRQEARRLESYGGAESKGSLEARPTKP